MSVGCSYQLKNEISDNSIEVKRCEEPVSKTFKQYDTGLRMPGLPSDFGNMCFDNARCDTHYGLKNEPIGDMDIDSLCEVYGEVCIPTENGYRIERKNYDQEHDR
jgi:hypothetical protein